MRDFAGERREKSVLGLSRGKHRPHALEEEQILSQYRLAEFLLGDVAVPVDVDCFHQQFYHVLRKKKRAK